MCEMICLDVSQSWKGCVHPVPWPLGGRQPKRTTTLFRADYQTCETWGLGRKPPEGTIPFSTRSAGATSSRPRSWMANSRCGASCNSCKHTAHKCFLHSILCAPLAAAPIPTCAAASSSPWCQVADTTCVMRLLTQTSGTWLRWDACLSQPASRDAWSTTTMHQPSKDLRAESSWLIVPSWRAWILHVPGDSSDRKRPKLAHAGSTLANVGPTQIDLGRNGPNFDRTRGPNLDEIAPNSTGLANIWSRQPSCAKHRAMLRSCRPNLSRIRAHVARCRPSLA